jgi:transposase-like protein
MHCSNCHSTQIIKNGSIHNGKPKWKCKACGRQFVANPTQRRIAEETKQLIDKLLLERISLAGIVRVTGVSARWLETISNRGLRPVVRHLISSSLDHVSSKIQGSVASW